MGLYQKSKDLLFQQFIKRNYRDSGSRLKLLSSVTPDDIIDRIETLEYCQNILAAATEFFKNLKTADADLPRVFCALLDVCAAGNYALLSAREDGLYKPVYSALHKKNFNIPGGRIRPYIQKSILTEPRDLAAVLAGSVECNLLAIFTSESTPDYIAAVQIDGCRQKRLIHERLMRMLTGCYRQLRASREKSRTKTGTPALPVDIIKTMITAAGNIEKGATGAGLNILLKKIKTVSWYYLQLEKKIWKNLDAGGRRGILPDMPAAGIKNGFSSLPKAIIKKNGFSPNTYILCNDNIAVICEMNKKYNKKILPVAAGLACRAVIAAKNTVHASAKNTATDNFKNFSVNFKILVKNSTASGKKPVFCLIGFPLFAELLTGYAAFEQKLLKITACAENCLLRLGFNKFICGYPESSDIPRQMETSLLELINSRADKKIIFTAKDVQNSLLLYNKDFNTPEELIFRVNSRGGGS
ncbi:MAG TPA: hypothetical protein DC049_04605 [Spirochaetia bacterium]|nr:hypothetical protein [Spirochaetia bacterium]